MCWRVQISFPSALGSAAHPNWFCFKEVPAVPETLSLSLQTPFCLLRTHYTYVVIKLMEMVGEGISPLPGSQQLCKMNNTLFEGKKELNRDFTAKRKLLNSFIVNTVSSCRMHLIQLAHNPMTSQKSLFTPLGLKFFNNTLQIRTNFSLFSKWTPSCNF